MGKMKNWLWRMAKLDYNYKEENTQLKAKIQTLQNHLFNLEKEILNKK
jgi:hypothetical protein